MYQPKYRIEIFWSDEDGGYIANVPDLRYCSAFGESYEEALREVLVAMELHLDTLRELERSEPLRKPLRLKVIKRDGRTEPFDREKLRASLAKAGAKQKVTDGDIDQIVDEIEAELRERRRHEVTSRRLGDMVLMRLRRIDIVAYLRFASVYRQYTDVDQFRTELVELEKFQEGLT
jgi:transcriptional repressor NrdR